MIETPLTGFGRKGRMYVKKRIPVEAKQILFAFAIKTLEGTMKGKSEDYLIKGVKGELYPCDKEIFETTYEDAGKAPSTVSLDWLKKYCKEKHQRHTVDLSDDVWNFTKGHNKALGDLLSAAKKKGRKK